MSAGIDYGMGQTNIDKETGIRFGVLPVNLLSCWSIDEIYTNGTDETFEEWREELIDSLTSAISSVLDDFGISGDEVSEQASELYDSLDLCDSYHGESSCYSYEDEGVKLSLDSHNDIWIFKSKYYTTCKFCSPCAPGAGYIKSFTEDGVKAYCLPHDWFELGECPYDVIYEVGTDKVVWRKTE